MIRFLFSCLFFFSIQAKAQLSLYDSVNIRHDKISTKALTVLGGWSVANLATGLIGQNKNDGEVRFFHQRNVLFGGINLAIAGLGLWRMKRDQSRVYTPSQTFKRTSATQKILLFNTGLDLAYLAYGLYTRERAFRYAGDKRDKLRGTGNSLLLQSGFLTALDFVQYFLQAANARRLNAKFDRLSLTATEGSFGLAYRF